MQYADGSEKLAHYRQQIADLRGKIRALQQSVAIACAVTSKPPGEAFWKAAEEQGYQQFTLLLWEGVCVEMRRLAIELDLAPKILDVRVDRPLVARELVAADEVDQLIARVHAAGNPGQRHEDTPLGRCELHRLAPDHDRSALLINYQLTICERLRTCRRATAATAPQDRLRA